MYEPALAGEVPERYSRAQEALFLMPKQSVTGDGGVEFFPTGVTVPSQNTQTREVKEGSNAPAVYGKRNPDGWIVERQQRLYMAMLNGQSRRQNILQHCKREGISEATGWRDWQVVEKWVIDDFTSERETILPRLNHMRMHLIEKAIRRGMLGIANAAIDSLGRACGELSQEQAAAAMPQLSITVENAVISNKKAPELPGADDAMASA